jgi:peptidoglycan L-alanyl-D-glutamate endopeptidase CwlK
MYDYKTVGKSQSYPSRNLDLLHPYVKELVLKFLEECKNDSILNGYEVKITQTLRSIEYQNKLYAQGRTAPGVIVTNSQGGNSMHNYGIAADFGIFKNGVYLSGNNSQEYSLYKECGKIAKNIGFIWGGDFKNFPDISHIQYTGKYDNNTALSLLKQGKTVDEVIGVKS